MKLSKVVNSPLFHTSYLDLLITSHNGLYRVRLRYTQCTVRHLELDVSQVSVTRRFPQPYPFSSGQPSFCWSAFRTTHHRVETGREEKKELMASDGMMTNWELMTHCEVHVNAERECVKWRDPSIRALCEDFSEVCLYLAAKPNMVELERAFI